MTQKHGKTKILYAITKANWGGAQRYVFDLASNLPKDKFDVIVCFGNGELLTSKLRECNIRTIKIKSLDREISFWNDFCATIELLKIVLVERPDILHLNSSKMGGMGALAGRLAGVKKIIFTAHGWAFNENRGKIFKTFVKFAHCLTIVLSHVTIAVSENVKNQICHFPFIKNKIVVIKHGIKDINFVEKQEARNFLLPKTKVGVEFFWIGIIAELHKIKGLEYAIRAMTELPNENNILIIIGGGEERENLIKLVSRLNLNKRVFLLGPIAEAAKYLQAFDIFLLPSISEALGYVLLEAGLASLPIIATNVGGIPEIIENRKNGLLVKPRSNSSISEAIVELESDLNKRKDFGIKSHLKVKSNFGFEGMIKKTMGIYGVGDL